MASDRYNMEMATRSLDAPPHYQFKPGRYSSHGLLLAALPVEGRGMRVLDVGCAGGYLSEALARRGFAVTSIDLHGIEPPAGVEFLAADLDDGLPPLPGLFDYVVCADVLEHLRDPLRLLLEFREYLNPEGELLCSLPNSGHAYVRWNVLLGRFPQYDRGLFDRTHLHFFTWDGWVELLDRAGFRIGETTCSSVPFDLAFPAWKDSWAIRSLEWLSFESARIWRRLFAYQFIVRAKGVLRI